MSRYDGDRDISDYYKIKEKGFLTIISSSSFLALMNSSADCSSFDGEESSLLPVKEREGKTKAQWHVQKKHLIILTMWRTWEKKTVLTART